MRYLLIAWMSAAAAVPAGAGRPLATEDAYTVGPAGLEAEFAFDYGTEEGCREVCFSAVGTAGVRGNLDVGLGVPLVYGGAEEGRDYAGVGDIAIWGKVVFMGTGDTGPTVAVVPSLKLPTGDAGKGLGSGSTDFGALAALSYATGVITFHGNVGYLYAVSYGGGVAGGANVALAAELTAAGPLTLGAELLADLVAEEVETGGEGGYPMAAAGGVCFAAARNVALDVGGRYGLGGAARDVNVTVGATWCLH